MTRKAKPHQKDDRYKFLNPPRIHRSMLPRRLPLPDTDGEDNVIYSRSIDITESIIVHYGGPKRGGKSASLSFAGMLALAAGMETYLTYPMCYYLVDFDGSEEFKEAKVLTLKEMLEMMNRKDFSNVFIGVDEAQWLHGAYSWNTNLNKFVDRYIQQIAHEDVAYHFASKLHTWVDTITRFETDLSIWCTDMYYKYPGNLSRGELIHWSIRDMSGMWTGIPWEVNKAIKEKTLYFQPLKGMYNHKQKLNPWELMGGVDLSQIMEKYQLGGDEEGGNGHKKWTTKEMFFKADQIAAQIDKMRPNEFWQTVGITSPNDKEEIKAMLVRAGIIEEKGARGKNYFHFIK